MLDARSVFGVDGIVAVVTGGGTGIGWNMAEALAVNGARKVYLLGRRPDVIKQAAAKHPDVMVPIVCDVTSKESLQSAVDQISGETGYINLLIANSGITGPRNTYDSSLSVGELRTQLLGPSMEDFTQTFNVNVTGAWFTMASFLELLDAGNKHAVSGEAGAFGAPINGNKSPSIQSQVVFVASLAAFSRAYFTAPAYGGSKAAILHLMKHTATNLAPYGIRANALAPGLFPSEMTTNMLSGRNPDEETRDNPFWIPTQKFGGEEEMAGAILYLASRAGSFTHGNVILNDGGRGSVIPATY
ncbi:short chain dehydrogenase/reductase [Diaporthe amygdali]|uniref:short chain dehydrogenase/reductase n=1 Tax=Phomopsis amygdali TaxID=1214568 RepID=UPI0022FE1169|nr:short chain dehydrogenase/reductase [Diaporthe amygdali]KAJ0117289.1 short chain dehydrogenase/reductase [Diaporthe amygdali]